MPVTAEQKVLTELVVQRLMQMQRAVVAALPGNTALHAEFLVGRPLPSSPAEVVQFGRLVAPAAREYRALLLNRGLDAAALARFSRAIEELEVLVRVAPPPAQSSLEEVPAKTVASKRKTTRKKAS